MDEATIAQTILTLAILAIFAGFLIWGIRSGQFKNVEEAKYRMLSDIKKSGEPPADVCGKEEGKT
jgi:nitrogen fixation-related uncharacterized protein